MQAVRVYEYGGAEKLVCEDVPEPRAGNGEVVIRQACAGINFADVYMRKGMYRGEHTYGTALPMIPGLEGSGVVEEVGKGVSGLATGDRVGYCLGTAGYAEYVSVAVDKVVKLPDGCDFDVAAAIMLQGATCHYLTHSAYTLGPGDWCLVHAAAGGVGQLLVQVAKARGAKVVATTSNEDKAARVRRLGADVVAGYADDDFVARVRDATDGQGVDVVYDSVGQSTIAASLSCMKLRGTYVLYGASSGAVESVSPMGLAEAGSVFFTRPHLAHYRRDHAEAQWRADEMFNLLERLPLDVAIDQRFPLSDAVLAHQRLESRQSVGKILFAL